MRTQFRLISIFCVALLIFPFSCTQKVAKNDNFYADLSQYIYAYTGGNIGRDDAIRVRFVNAAVQPDQVGQPVPAEIFRLDPEVKGQAIWEDDRTILLKPTDPLAYGAKYSGHVQLKKIYAEAPISVFDFAFRVRELAFEVMTDGLRADDLTNLRRQQIVGKIITNDPVAQEVIEPILTAKQGNNTLNITWSHIDGGRTHAFTVNGVERGNTRSGVDLSWDGTAMGAKKTGSTQIAIPSIDDFEVLSVKVEQVENQYIVVNFSDPVSTSQNLDGLISISEYSGGYRFTVDRNFLRIYPAQRIVGEHNVVLSNAIQNINGKRMKADASYPINFDDLNPGVRLVGRGAIIPGDDKGSIIFPFEAVGLNAVDVEIFKIYDSNILQFLQVNDIEGENNQLERVGKIVLQKKIDLKALNPDASKRVWQRYALDLKDMIKQDPGAIYQVRLVFRRSYASSICTENPLASNTDNTQSGPNAGDEMTGPNDEPRIGQTDDYGNLISLWGGYRGIYWIDYDSEYGDDEGWWGESEDYDYERQDDPCAKEYYNREHFARRNVFVSDLGLTAKRGKDNSLFAAVTDLHTTQPVSGIAVEFLNYQLQPIGTGKTSADGTLMLESTRDVPYIMVAKDGNRRGYLRMADGNSLSLSRFDVAGVEMQKGMKGYIYGERGVWRPGDSLYLQFVLEDKTGKLPVGHPVSFELTDPKGAVRYRTVVTKGVNGVFALHCATAPEAPTGNWTAKVSVGSATWSKNIKIETVKPNRLKLNLDFGKKMLSADDEEIKGELEVKWLHGAVAKGLKAKVELQVRTAVTQFPNFKGYVFEDPTRSFESDEQVVFDGTIDDNGKATIPVTININDAAPGKLIAKFKMRAFEKGGDYSTDQFAMDYFPYKNMVGINIPTNNRGNKQIEFGQTGTVDFVCVDKNGRPMANRTLELGLYRCDWRWWWDEDRSSNVAQFNSATHVNALEHTTVKTDANGRAKWSVKPATWGRYLVRAVDATPAGSGKEAGLAHATGDFFWVGYPEQVDDLRTRNAAAMLPLTADREKYNVGEEVVIKVPASENGRILVTIENGTRVIDHLWFEAHTGDNLLKFTATAAMTPAVYAHVSLLQPHAQTKNDLPIRMYGVVPVNIENPVTRLVPQIEMADVLKPGEPFTVKLRETSGKACAYTLDIVDEGLLDLTRFQTPNPWEAFFAREALGVQSWDIYDYVLGAYGVELERILSIGGDGINQKSKNGAQVNRFKPAVVHVGPFYLEKGKTATHTLKIDNYVGSVRVMAVCSAPAPDSKGAYGSAEKTCPVRKPLMILPTLPRVLGPGETLRLPVDVFAMEKQVKTATIRVKEHSGLVLVQGSPVNTLNFSQPGEEMTYFNLKVGKKTGAARFTIEAQGGGETTTSEIEILVRNPMPVTTAVWEGAIEPGKEWSAGFDADQFAELQGVALEVSALPPMNFSRHMQYLIQYPHGCIEQTTSAAFPQLYVDIIMPLSQKQRDDITKNVTKAIQKIQNQQDYTGGFTYWPGGSVSDWASTYAGHFLLEAKSKGYSVPDNVLQRWVDYQTNIARNWNRPTSTTNTDQWYTRQLEVAQAYRLYSLALAGKPALGDMNRLREVKEMYTQSAYLLANAYAQAGKPEVARELTSKGWKEDYTYNWCDGNYGSDLRDRALILETYVATGDNARAEAMVNYFSQQLSDENNHWSWNTQALATALRALSKYVVRGSKSNGPAFTYKTTGSGYQAGDNSKPVALVPFTNSSNAADKLMVKNTGSVKLYARLVATGQRTIEADILGDASNINMDVRYETSDGKALDVSKVPQGTDFVAVVTIKRQTKYTFPFNEIALTQIFPSGWEITNSRMGNFDTNNNSAFDYQDIRDDRVLTYFDLTSPKPTDNDYQRTYRIQLNAAYAGRFYLPAVSSEAMYDSRIRASMPGWWVEVI